MAIRASSSGIIKLGVIEAPVKLFIAASPERVKFSNVTPDGNPLSQKYIDPETGAEVKMSDCDKSFSDDVYGDVFFTKEEVKQFSSPTKNGNVLVEEFVPLRSIDMVNVEKSYYLKPAKGGAEQFRLLANAMLKSKKVAVATWTNGGKELMALVRPYRGGMILHQLFFSNEVRDYEDNIPDVDIAEENAKLAEQLIEEMSSKTFNPNKYHDKYAERVAKAAKAKATGQTVTSDDEDLDMISALTASLQSRS